jgi:aerobic-type carbon monoxide dehydrogenase small subunit (CoxS/CutS family)
MIRRIRINVNGVIRHVATDPQKPLLWVLHENLGLTATPLGCEAGTCDACRVEVNGTTQRACMLVAADVERAEVITAEGSAARAAQGRVAVGRPPSRPAPPETER